MIGWRRSAAAGLLLLAVYVGLSFLNSPRGFLGTDTGGKVATLRVMSESGRFDPDLGYWAERWDPDGALHPIGYTSHTSSGKWVNVTTLPALWVGWQLYRLGGYRAALLVPMAGAVAAAFAGLALLRRLGAGERHAWWGFWLLGLASPLAVYALDFWEHTLGVALLAWAVVWLVDGGRWRALGAGVLFGAAATMRTESLVYLGVAGLAAPAFAWRAAWDRAQGAPVVEAGLVGVLLAAGAAVPLVLNELLERAVVGSTVRASRVLFTAGMAGDLPATRTEEAVTTLLALQGGSQGIVLGAGLVALLVFGAIRRDVGLSVLAVAGAGVLVVVRVVAGGLGFVPGLVPAWVVPAAAASAFGRAQFRISNSTRPNCRALVLTIAVGAIPIVLATQLRGGAGPQWAGRYLLPSGLLLAVLGWAALERRPLVVQAAFAGVAALVTLAGIAWLSVRSHDVDRAIAALESRPEPAVVSAVYHLAREGGATYGDKHWLTLSPSPVSTRADAAEVLRKAGIDTFASVELEAEPVLTFPGFRVKTTSDLRLFDGVDLRVTSWARSP